MRKSGFTKCLALIFVNCFMMITATGCGSWQTPAVSENRANINQAGELQGESAEKRPLRIALSNSYISNSWREETIMIFEAYAKRKKAEGVISDYYISSSGNDPQAQINDIKSMMAEGYDAILINAASPTALAHVLDEAAEAGIIVVAYDNTVDSDKIYNVNTDQIKFGEVMTQWLMDQMGGRGNIFVLKGVEGTTVSRERIKGMRNILAKYPDVKVLQEGFGKWDNAATAIEIDKMLISHRGIKISGILTEGCGEVAIAEALKRYGIDPETVPMTGEFFNGFFRVMKEEGVKGIAIGQPPYLVAEAFDIAVKVYNGEKVDKLTLIPNPVATYEEVNKYYHPGLPDSFSNCYTDAQNTYKLNLKDIIPDK